MDERLRFIVDQGTSPAIAAALGHDAVHTSQVGLAAASDAIIVGYALKDDRVIVTQNIDYSDILYQRRWAKPSIILFRDRLGRPARQAALVQTALPQIASSLAEGAIVVISDASVRTRRLSDSGSTP